MYQQNKQNLFNLIYLCNKSSKKSLDLETISCKKNTIK